VLAAGYNALGPQMCCVPRDIDRIFFYVVVFQPLRRINININRHFLTYLLTYLLTYYSVLPQVETNFEPKKPRYVPVYSGR